MLVEVNCVCFTINVFGASCKYPVKTRWFWGLSVATRKLPINRVSTETETPSELVGRGCGGRARLAVCGPGEQVPGQGVAQGPVPGCPASLREDELAGRPLGGPGLPPTRPVPLLPPFGSKPYASLGTFAVLASIGLRFRCM